MTAAHGQAVEARRPWVLPEPTPGAILAARLRDAAETRARRAEQAVDVAAAPEGFAADLERRPTTTRESGSFAGVPDPAILASTREDKSTSAPYLTAVARVRDAYAIQEGRLTEAESEALAGAWSIHDLVRARKVTKKLEAVRRRAEALEHCVEGRWCVHRFRCGRCGLIHDGPPLTCNQRVCPACVPKLRAQNIAHVLELLEAVDRRRQRDGKRTARWRFVTLTVRSFDSFLPMRRFLATAWGKLIRHRLWTRNVGACVAVWETTHTAAGWHVHIHALVDAFLPREQLVKAWAKVTHGLGADVGVHISEPKGGRKSIARELAKYVAKDLGGACTEQTDAWGVAGTAERLAEFLDGSFRWRTLRTYGDCYAVADELRGATGTLECEDCHGPMEYLETAWRTAEQIEAERAARRRERERRRPVEPGPPAAT